MDYIKILEPKECDNVSVKSNTTQFYKANK
jgi:hypothetical protein